MPKPNRGSTPSDRYLLGRSNRMPIVGPKTWLIARESIRVSMSWAMSMRSWGSSGLSGFWTSNSVRNRPRTSKCSVYWMYRPPTVT